MAVKNRARRISDRVLLVVAFGQHRIERGYGTGFFIHAVAGAFDELWNLREHRGGITLRDGWFADSERKFTLGLRKPGQGIHQQQHVQAAVAEILSNCRCAPRAVQTHQGWIVRRSRDDYRFFEIFFAEDVFDELSYFPAAFADKADDY